MNLDLFWCSFWWDNVVFVCFVSNAFGCPLGDACHVFGFLFADFSFFVNLWFDSSPQCFTQITTTSQYFCATQRNYRLIIMMCSHIAINVIIIFRSTNCTEFKLYVKLAINGMIIIVCISTVYIKLINYNSTLNHQILYF